MLGIAKCNCFLRTYTSPCAYSTSTPCSFKIGVFLCRCKKAKYEYGLTQSRYASILLDMIGEDDQVTISHYSNIRIEVTVINDT